MEDFQHQFLQAERDRHTALLRQLRRELRDTKSGGGVPADQANTVSRKGGLIRR